jgi:hypothetical protein
MTSLRAFFVALCIFLFGLALIQWGKGVVDLYGLAFCFIGFIFFFVLIGGRIRKWAKF